MSTTKKGRPPIRWWVLLHLKSFVWRKFVHLKSLFSIHYTQSVRYRYVHNQIIIIHIIGGVRASASAPKISQNNTLIDPLGLIQICHSRAAAITIINIIVVIEKDSRESTPMTTVKRILIKARVYPRPQFILSFLPSLVPQNVLCILILKYGAAMTQSTEFIFRTFFIADASRLSRLSHSLTDKNLGIHCK